MGTPPSQPPDGSPLSILLLTSHFPPEKGSASRLFFELAESLAAKGHKLSVVTGFPRYLMWESRQNGLIRRDIVGHTAVTRVVNLPLVAWKPHRRGLDQLFLAVMQFVGAATIRKPDVILVYSPPLPTCLTAWALSRLWNVPFVVNVQDLFPRSAIDLGLMKGSGSIGVFQWLERLIYRAADGLAVISDGNRDHVICTGANPEKVTVISNWSDTDFITPGPADPTLRQELGLGQCFVVQYSGVMGYSQDLDTVIVAADILRDEPGIRFHFGGDGIERERLVSKASELSLDNIVFTPLQPYERYPTILRTADVGLISLRPEVKSPSVPSKLFNIMAAGKPVIVSAEANGDARKIISDAQCGVWVPPGQPRRLADAILHLYQHREEAKEMGRRGREAAEHRYGRGQCVQRYAELLQQLVTRPNTVSEAGI